MNSRLRHCLPLLAAIFIAPLPLKQAFGQEATTRDTVIAPRDAIVLGLVEGITEFLPVSSTGHLVIAGDLLGLRDRRHLSDEQYEAIEAYEIVIQSGAMLAVLALYGSQVLLMIQGLMGRSQRGLKLALNLIAAFVPTAVLGLLLHKIIKTYLQSTGPVIGALVIGGVGMILFEKSRWAVRSREQGRSLDDLTWREAVAIGFCQCLSMWPGTSRSMTTIVGGMAVGLSPSAAAQFSFILGLPTLLAATGLKAVKDGRIVLEHVGPLSLVLGLTVAGVSAFVAVKGFVAYLNRRGLTVFGYYRLILAAGLLIVLSGRAAL